MFRFIKDTLFWKQTFESRFAFGMVFFRKFDGKQLQEKRYFWRQRQGRLLGLRPAEAAFRAFEDFADDYFYDNRSRYRDLEEIAFALKLSAPSEDQKGNYIDNESFLKNRWKKYLENYEARENAEKVEKESRCREILSFKFNQQEIDAAWISLLSGNVSIVAKSVWRCAYPRKTPYDIAAEAGVSLKEVMFWAIVFRNHHLMREELLLNKIHMYCREQPIATDPSKIVEPLAALIRKLNWPPS